jgi:hypothetical protein
MADYDPVTVDDFFTRFPRFATADEYLIASLLEEASGQVDDSWLATDFKPATLYLVAHMYVMETGDAATNTGAIVSESFSGMSRTYANKGSKATNLDATEFGRRFVELRNGNFPGVVIV